LGGNLLKDRSHDRLTTGDAIQEEIYGSKLVKNFGQTSGTNLHRFNDLAGSSKLEDSVAAVDRQPRRIDGLT
jgi:hypothetical protein